jgi:CHAD domain-containing protein
MISMTSDDLLLLMNAGEGPARYVASIPPQYEESSWLEFELSRARALADALSLELEPLTRKPTAARVHSTRVVLRRWFSVWALLREDHWESGKFKHNVIKKLRRLSKLLGELRDWDVNLELGASFGCPQELLAHWEEERKLIRKEVKDRIGGLGTAKLLMRLRNYLQRHYEKLRTESASSPVKAQSTYERLNEAVTNQEERVKELEATASTPEELHQLRLAIKRWRYLMTEFFGLTNLQLVKAQQLLGRLNDYKRLENLLIGEELPEVASKLKAERERILVEFAGIRGALPYGLRPLMISISTTQADEASHRLT